MKVVPEPIARGYARLILRSMENRIEENPGILLEMGVFRSGGKMPDLDLLKPFLDIVKEIYRDSPPYRFGENPEIYHKIMDFMRMHWTKSLDFNFPRDIVFIDRSLSGHFGNLCKL